MRLATAVTALTLIALAGAVRPAWVASAASPETPSAEAVVELRPGVTATDALRVAAAHGVTVVDWMPGTSFLLVRGRGHGAVPVDALAHEGVVASARPVVAMRAMGTPAPVPTPDDPLFRSQWNMRMIGIPQAWSVSTGVGATVAILDTGVAYEDFGIYRRAPDLAGTRFVPGWDFVDDTGHPDDRPRSGRPSHGTHIAGTVAETSGNGLGAVGAAPGAAIMPIRVLSPDGTGTGWAVARGLRFAADHGADVANLSLGNSTGSPELADAVSYAEKKGVTVVASAGDDGAGSLSYPAAYPGVIAVGAVRVDRTRVAYSSYGAGLGLMAPGGDLTVDQNGDGLDDGIVQQTLYGTPSTFCFCFLEGTSSAAAHVSAAAALLIASRRATTPAEVLAVLLATADRLGPALEYGAGLLRVDRAVGVSGGGLGNGAASGTGGPAVDSNTPPAGSPTGSGGAPRVPVDVAPGIGAPAAPPTSGRPATAVGAGVAAAGLAAFGCAARRHRRRARSSSTRSRPLEPDR